MSKTTTIIQLSVKNDEGEREIVPTEVPTYGTYGVWTVTPSSIYWHWQHSRDPEKGKKPDDRWNVTHIPTGYGILSRKTCDMANRNRIKTVAKLLNETANLETLPGLASTDFREVGRIDGLQDMVRKAVLYAGVMK